AALHAKKIPVDAGHIAIVRAQDFVVAHPESGLATVRTVCAHRRRIVHFPRTRLVTVGAARERAHWANVDAHAALFAIEVIFAIGNDDAVGATHAHAERLYVHAFVAYAHAAETQDAARRVVVDEVRPLLFGSMNLFLDETRGVCAVTKDHVLQFALAAFVADRAIEWVIGEQELQHVLAGVAHLLGVRFDDHAFGGDQRARGLQLWKFLDFHQTHAARGL